MIPGSVYLPAAGKRVRHRTRSPTSRAATKSPASPQSAKPPAFHPAVEWLDPAALKPYRRNARTHSKKQIAQIAASIGQFGFTNPVLIGADHTIIAGHGRVEAAKQLGMAQVPTIRLDHLSEAEVRAYVIADNRLAELAGWDREILAIELQALIELDFEVEITGFATAEIDLMIDGIGTDAPDAADDVPDTDTGGPTVTRPGDLWQLGDHRLLCGNALEPTCHRVLLGETQAQMVFADAPYNTKINGHVCGLGRIHHREFAMASGEMSEAEFTSFLATALQNAAHHSAEGALHYCCMDWRHGYELQTAARQAKLSLLNLCIWVKDNGGMGSFYRSQTELVFVFKNGFAPHINNVELGRYGRYRTNVWQYAGVNSFRRGRLEELALHPTMKPVALVADAIRDCTRRGHIVLDPFAGSGTTIIAAEKTGRVARAIELDPAYVDVAVRRWQQLTKQSAKHAVTGRTFEQAMREREVDTAPSATADGQTEGGR